MDNAISSLKPATQTMAEEITKELSLYYRYWGKAKLKPDNDGPAYHLLPYHCMDVRS